MQVAVKNIFIRPDIFPPHIGEAAPSDYVEMIFDQVDRLLIAVAAIPLLSITIRAMLIIKVLQNEKKRKSSNASTCSSISNINSFTGSLSGYSSCDSSGSCNSETSGAVKEKRLKPNSHSSRSSSSSSSSSSSRMQLENYAREPMVRAMVRESSGCVRGPQDVVGPWGSRFVYRWPQ